MVTFMIMIWSSILLIYTSTWCHKSSKVYFNEDAHFYNFLSNKLAFLNHDIYCFLYHNYHEILYHNISSYHDYIVASLIANHQIHLHAKLSTYTDVHFNGVIKIIHWHQVAKLILSVLWDNHYLSKNKYTSKHSYTEAVNA